jgi:hypothetical protein
MADIVGFHSFEPWQLALKQATMEMESEDDCPICDKKN